MSVVLSNEEAREILEHMEYMMHLVDGHDMNQTIPELIERNQMHGMYYTLKERLGIPRDQVVTQE